MTGIQWTDETWNPTTGCDKVSPGCGLPRFDGDDTGGCYAMAMARRLKGMGQAKYQKDGDPRTSGPGFGVTLHPDVLDRPLHWREPRRVFVNSMSDLFHEAVPDEFIAQVFAAMALAPQHTFQLLTKRHARMRSLLSGGPHDAWLVPRHPSPFVQSVYEHARTLAPHGEMMRWPLPNLWLGVSVEDQKWADIRIPALLDTPAAVRFVSAEPLLGPIRMRASLLVGRALDPPDGIGWLIAGGESGPGARPCELDWLRSLRDQCADADVPYFCKQLGSVLGRQLGAGSKGGDWDAWPEDLRIREFPRAAEPVTA